MLPARLLRLPVLPGTSVRVAVGLRSRLTGLALLARPEDEVALLLPRTRSVHTLGMRFPLDLHWLGPDGRAVRVDRNVPPWRVRGCARARAVVERPSNCRR
jgi:uncharacterized protein